MVRFGEIRKDDVLLLPGRQGRPDLYQVRKISHNRAILESLNEKGRLIYKTSNQFNDAGFEKAMDMPGVPTKE